MAREHLRLKIQIDSVNVEFTKDLDTNFWYYLDLLKQNTIHQLKCDLIARIIYFKKRQNMIKFASIRLSLDGYELPPFETTRTLRDSDNIVYVVFNSQV